MLPTSRNVTSSGNEVIVTLNGIEVIVTLNGIEVIVTSNVIEAIVTNAGSPKHASCRTPPSP